MSGIKIIFGGGAIQRDRGFGSHEKVAELFATLKEYKVGVIDTAQLYGASETILGEEKAGDQFIIDTKAWGGFNPGTAEKDALVAEAKASIKRLGVKQVDIFYIHSPDASVPISSTLAGINEVHSLGLFKRFGLSNFQAEDVRKVHDHCKAHGYVLPTVYQGNYSPVARLQETLLFPLLKELGIAFYAYSPMAGGFLTKTKQDILDGKGRFDTSTDLGKMYSTLYSRPSYLEALAEWGGIAEEFKIDRAELAYRWVTYNSALKKSQGDGIIFGGRNIEQVRETLEGITHGPLPEEAVKRIDDVWEKIKHEAPLDNYNSFRPAK